MCVCMGVGREWAIHAGKAGGGGGGGLLGGHWHWV